LVYYIPDWRIKWLYQKEDIHGRVLVKEDLMMLSLHLACQSVESVEKQKSHIDYVVAVESIKGGLFLALILIWNRRLLCK